MGVFPAGVEKPLESWRLPHARGGVSVFQDDLQRGDLSSPRPWGCFPAGVRRFRREGVFPTPVGVFLPTARSSFDGRRLPHARGGVSIKVIRPFRTLASSPRPWGCFSRSSLIKSSRVVFPTPVGVFPEDGEFHPKLLGLPHARGGCF